MHQYAEKRLQEQKEMRELVEQVVEGHKNAKQAKIKLQKYKQQIGIYILPEKNERWCQMSPNYFILVGELKFLHKGNGSWGKDAGYTFPWMHEYEFQEQVGNG